jgi:hypothetical protein
MQTELAGTPVEKVKELHAKRKELKRELKLYKPKVAPVEHALIQKQIGDVYFQLAEIQYTIDQHSRDALKAYENALYYYPAATNPVIYSEIRFA